eukprot:109035-Amphidinium_carterae.2
MLCDQDACLHICNIEVEQRCGVIWLAVLLKTLCARGYTSTHAPPSTIGSTLSDESGTVESSISNVRLEFQQRRRASRTYMQGLCSSGRGRSCLCTFTEGWFF